MSVEKTPARTFKVRWRDESGRPRARTFARKRDALAFDIEIKRRKQTGELAILDAGRQTLADFAAEWWDLYAAANLSPRTLAIYAHLWDRHVHPQLGPLPLRSITVEAIQRFAADMAASGVGAPTRRKTLALLGGVLQRAVEWNRISFNPARAVRKPPAGRLRAVQPLAPRVVEDLRWNMRLRDATLVSLLAYTGLRPGEALGLSWAHVGERSILIERAVVDGDFKTTKTGQRRTVPLIPAIKGDLTTWRAAANPPSDDSAIFARADGGPWVDDDWRNWRHRVFIRHARALGLQSARPYDLRHSAASLWIHEGRSIVEIAAWLGHKPTMTLDTYAHVMADLGDERVSAEDAIRRARLVRPWHLYPLQPATHPLPRPEPASGPRADVPPDDWTFT